MKLAGKRIAFRADASLAIGTGHIMRCLTLADMLLELGFECRFICRAHQGNLSSLINARGYSCQLLDLLPTSLEGASESLPSHSHWLGGDWEHDAVQTKSILADWFPDWLIVDHYALDFRWEGILRSHVGRIMAIDDLADRKHDCDLLLDQNLGHCKMDYIGLLPMHSRTLVGPQFALLRPQFSQLRESSLIRRRTPVLKSLLVTMGGVDQDNITGEILKVLARSKLPIECHITVVMGPTAPWLADIKVLAAQLKHPVEVLVSVGNMAELMEQCDLAIGAAGSTSWERCCLGIPTFMVIIAENQIGVAKKLKEINAAEIFQLGDNLEHKLGDWLDKIIHINGFMRSQSENSSIITDGCGVFRVANEMVEIAKGKIK